MNIGQQSDWDEMLAADRAAIARHPEWAHPDQKTRLAVDAELRDVRAALAASQAREATSCATLGEIVNLMGYSCDASCDMPSCKAYRLAEAILVDPSPASDALGRVARASVAYREERDVCPDFEVTRALIAADVALKAAVDELLVVAPQWGEPRGEG